MENNKQNTHKNHRQRLKSKVKDFGLECLAYHEVLELLLTYTIPRRDTNPIAHELIEHFGSFSNVIDADFYDLQKVDGIGAESAMFINVLSSFMDIYNKSKQERETHILNGPGACAKFFRSFYPIKTNEYMIMVCLSANKRVLKTFKYSGNDEASISVDLRKIFNNIQVNGVKSVVLFHTHPMGSVEPSVQDIEATQRILNMCCMSGINLDDHIILNETDYYSFKQNSLIDKMKLKYLKVFGSIT